MPENPLNVLLVNTLDRDGGAERIASSLLDGCRERGHNAWLAVAVKRGEDPGVLRIHNADEAGPWSGVWWRLQAQAARLHGAGRPFGEKLRRLTAMIAEPQSIVDTLRGYENSYYPGTYALLDLPPQPPDILHCHSLQRGYFELEALPVLSERVPVMLTLHDAWLLSGHCTHPFGCDRWLTGCGHCPDLTIPPRVLRDETARNWRRKRDIFASSRVWIAADSQWLLGKVERSMLSYVEARTIYPGVDLSRFQPGSKAAARAELGLPQDAAILLFVATKATVNPWKDFPLLERMLPLVQAQVPDRHVILLVVGDPQGEEMAKRGNVWLAPPTYGSERLNAYYRAADLYTHAAHVETFGLVVAEAQASGTPVVVTDTAALPELVDEGVTGLLAPPGDAQAMADCVAALLRDAPRREAMGRAAVEFVQRFDVNHTVEAYINWYEEILENEKRRKRDASGMVDQ